MVVATGQTNSMRLYKRPLTMVWYGHLGNVLQFLIPYTRVVLQFLIPYTRVLNFYKGFEVLC